MHIGSTLCLIAGLLFNSSLWAFTAPSLFSEPIDEQTKLENEVTLQERIAEPQIQKMRKILDDQFGRPEEAQKMGPTPEFLRAMRPTVKQQLSISNPAIPLHKRLVEKERQDIIEGYVLQSGFLNRLSGCTPNPPTAALFQKPEEQAALLAAIQCSRNETSRFFSEFHLAFEAQRQRIRQLHLPAHSEKARVYLSREYEEQTTADLRARADRKLKFWQSMEDILVYVKTHKIQRTSAGLGFSTKEDLAEYRRLVDVMKTAMQNQ